MGDWPQNLEPVPPIIAVGSSACIDEGMTSYNQIGTITGWQYGANVGVFIPFTINRIVTVYKMFYSATTAVCRASSAACTAYGAASRTCCAYPATSATAAAI